MSDIQQPNPASEEEKPGIFSSLKSSVAALSAVVGLVTAAYSLGHSMGVDAGGENYQSQINDLRGKLASQMAASTISDGRVQDLQNQMKEWQDAYKTLTTNSQQLMVENDALKEQLKQLDPCAYLEQSIDRFERSGDSARRDNLLPQLTSCKH